MTNSIIRNALRYTTVEKQNQVHPPDIQLQMEIVSEELTILAKMIDIHDQLTEDHLQVPPNLTLIDIARFELSGYIVDLKTGDATTGD